MLSGVNNVGPSSYSYDMGISNMQSTLNNLMALMQRMIEAKAEISKDLHEKLLKADQEIMELQKMIDKKVKLPKLNDQIHEVNSALDRLMSSLEARGGADGELGQEYIALTRLQAELKRKAAIAQGRSEGGPAASGEQCPGTIA